MARRIALLGAESTGKTQLATGLAAHLRERGHSAVAVPEVLRTWCTRQGRAPRPEEQLAIAQEQERLVDSAAADYVIADTTALMVLVHSGMLFEDSELDRFALARQRGYDATLVTGLDLPWVPDGLHRGAAAPREPVDALVRTLLQRAGVAYQVVYGSGALRLQGALHALQSAGVLPDGTAQRADDCGAARAWTWVCEKCSDPACEHRLFTKLRETRG
ncbi:MAG TPA: ATP-binding protein [Ramlibacter sp.]|uniref:ATP-binding protein n=1 Tax=Ramlibacter sp. TaxID=1917967 RepID=UPI002ED0D082